MRTRVLVHSLSLVVALGLLAPALARARGYAEVAALQVALRARNLYLGDVDGYAGSGTSAGVRAFQRRAHLLVDGVAGPQTRRALGRLGGPRLGSRVLQLGRVGGDVAGLQFLLAWRGFPSGRMDGGFGPHLLGALIRYQRWMGVGADGVAGPVTIATLRRRPVGSPFGLRVPVAAPLGDGFGPRGNTFHPGLDYLAGYGASVRAARGGRVSFAGYDSGGYGNLVVIAHDRGVTTWYAHLSRIYVGRGERVSRGERIGLVGATGYATGPHLHFEERLAGAAIDPRTGL